MATDPHAFLIWSIEHTAWWRPGKMGYTPHLEEAGRYGAADADAIVRRANIVKFHECAIPVEAVIPHGVHLTLTPSQLMALRSLVADHLLCPRRTEVYVDVADGGTEITPEELLARLMDVL
jgi:hypothetical protein